MSDDPYEVLIVWHVMVALLMIGCFIFQYKGELEHNKRAQHVPGSPGGILLDREAGIDRGQPRFELSIEENR